MSSSSFVFFLSCQQSFCTILWHPLHEQVMIASRNRSMSQQFWGLEQAKDASAAQKDHNTIAQGMMDRLEDENTALKDDNARWGN